MPLLAAASGRPGRNQANQGSPGVCGTYGWGGMGRGGPWEAVAVLSMRAFVVSTEAQRAGAPRGAREHLCDRAMSRQVLPYWLQCVSVCVFDALYPVGKHLPAHGTVTRCSRAPRRAPALRASAETTKALTESTAIASHGTPTARHGHPGPALPTTHPGAALVSLVTPGPA